MTDISQSFAAWCLHKAYKPTAAAMKIYYDELEKKHRSNKQIANDVIHLCARIATAVEAGRTE